MPTEMTVDLSVVPTALKCLRTKAVSAANCITVTAISEQQPYKHFHHSTSSCTLQILNYKMPNLSQSS